ncbi:DUF1501 domain-containing protein [Prosthecobacter sp.]|uniref:DUF1501 domain-containing protein n=1 Tax=Prosthecobacter sp. TaxID=1965333 RepID=UPI001DE4BC7B|nr:DUF1501 domain-containing protein [Prosthecobacter sp.]MCB1275202.1 DUF1501 domain-containing protein [Prosthecobacter sp.]
MHLISKDTSIARRQFLERCAASAFGLSLPTFLTSSPALAAAESAQGFGKAKRVIFLMMGGGMTHIDTLDPKEETKGPTTTLLGNSAGGQFTNHIPQTAKIADKMCVIRSMTAKIGTHFEAQYFMRTAYKKINTIAHPMLGAWGQKVLGRSHEVLPSSVSVCRDAGLGNGFLPASMSPLAILDPDAGLQYLKPEAGVSEIRSRLETLNELDRVFREAHPDRNVQAYTDFYEDSVRMMSGQEGEAFDLSKEPDSMRDAYGRSKFGQGCLLARRLVEAGVRFVEVRSSGWDMHKNLVTGLEEVAPSADQAYAQLIRDLDDRGMLAETLVVLASEFGRSPNYSGGGRNHYPVAFSTALAGGGVKAGHIHGATDSSGGKVVDKPMTVEEFHATIGWAMGIRPDLEIAAPNGRPFKVGAGSAPVLDVFA